MAVLDSKTSVSASKTAVSASEMAVLGFEMVIPAPWVRNQTGAKMTVKGALRNPKCIDAARDIRRCSSTVVDEKLSFVDVLGLRHGMDLE